MGGGIIKEIDELGRLQIPKEIRKRLGFNQRVELVVTQEGLLIKSEEYHLVKLNKNGEETNENNSCIKLFYDVIA